MRFRNNYFFILLTVITIAFLFLALGAEFCHNHDDGDVHDDCFICKLVSAFIAVLFHAFVIFTGVFFSCVVLFNIRNVSEILFFTSFQTRAPPISPAI